MNDPSPTATGTLEATPLAHLLVYALERRLNGTVVLESPSGGRSALRLEGGVPTRAKTAEPVVYLGRLLLETGAIDEATYNRTLVPVAEERKLHGQVLLADGAIDDETLLTALREQLTRQLLWMFALPPQTAYGYYEGVDFLERYGGTETARVEPLALLWRGIRSSESLERIGATLARIGDSVLRLHSDAQPARFRFGGHAQAVVDVLRARPQSLADLVASGLDAEPVIRRIVYTLLLTRHIDTGAGAQPISADESLVSRPPARTPSDKPAGRATTPGAAALRGVVEPVLVRVSSGPPPRSSVSARLRSSRPPAELSEVDAFKEEIRTRAERAAAQNYYDILGVPRDASGAHIQSMFFQLAKRWHPDRLGPEYDDVRPSATRIFSRMSEAHHLLSDELRRKEYDEVLKSGGGSAEEQEEVQTVLRAATSFQKAEVLLKKNNLVAAEEHARIAAEGDPRQADYMALYAWIQAQKPDRQGQPLDDLIARMNESVSLEPNNPRVRWYRGQLLKRVGKDALAMRDFRFIVDEDPKHLDAVREIRLYEMRRANRPSTRPPPSVKKSDRSRTPGRRPGASMHPGDAKRPGLMNKDIGQLFGKFFKR